MNNKKKTLVLLTPGFASSEADSTCLPMQQNFVKFLKRTYPHLNIIILSFQYPYHKRAYKWFNTTVISFNGRNKGGLSRLFLRRKINAALKKISSKNEITGLLSFWYGECAVAGKKFGEKYGIKHYCWILGQDARRENKYPGYISLKADELIALSDFLQAEFERNHNVKPFAVIPLGIDVKQIDASAKEKNIDILGVGSLIALKQYAVFIEIIAEIKKELPALKAMIAGKGPEKNRLQNQIKELGLEENVSLTGELSHHEVLQLMQRTKLLLHPSSYEGFSGVCIEALSNGAHVISFCRAMKSEISHWHIVASKNEMKQKAIEILLNPEISYYASAPFLMSNTVKAIAGLYNNFTGK